MPTEAISQRVELGQNKAISALAFIQEGDALRLRVEFHMPIRQEAGKTYYKALGAEVEITELQRIALIHLFGGSPQ